MESQSKIPLVFGTDFPILSVLCRSRRETREKIQIPWYYLPLNCLRLVLVVLAVLYTQCRKARVLLAWMNSHLETLETKQISYHLAPVGLLPHLWLAIALHPPRTLPCRRAGTI